MALVRFQTADATSLVHCYSWLKLAKRSHTTFVVAVWLYPTRLPLVDIHYLSSSSATPKLCARFSRTSVLAFQKGSCQRDFGGLDCDQILRLMTKPQSERLREFKASRRIEMSLRDYESPRKCRHVRSCAYISLCSHDRMNMPHTVPVRLHNANPIRIPLGHHI